MYESEIVMSRSLKRKGRTDSSFEAWFLALFELGIGALLASLQKYTSPSPRKGSLRAYAFLGFLFLAARVLTNLSVRLAPIPLFRLDLAIYAASNPGLHFQG